MKASSVGDKLTRKPLLDPSAGADPSWNAWDVHQVNDLRKLAPEIRIERTPIAKVEARINSKLHQIGQRLAVLFEPGAWLLAGFEIARG